LGAHQVVQGPPASSAVRKLAAIGFALVVLQLGVELARDIRRWTILVVNGSTADYYRKYEKLGSMYLTKQPAPAISEPRDRPENETGVPHVEVTPEMIEAGCEVYARTHPDTYHESVDARTVVKIFRAMIEARS